MQRLTLQMAKPTMAELLARLNDTSDSPKQGSYELIQTIWNAYDIMSDHDRNSLLKGILDRSSEKQIEFLGPQISVRLADISLGRALV
jgi:hypothetical protein